MRFSIASKITAVALQGNRSQGGPKAEAQDVPSQFLRWGTASMGFPPEQIARETVVYWRVNPACVSLAACRAGAFSKKIQKITITLIIVILSSCI